ncbi:hypothetical protein N9P20_00965 [Polaribacter sp.]|jgi:hypothetical protein|nr:hypothetical protein [Polaribacter sp.]
MKYLIDRLTSENKIKLDALTVLYPNIAENIAKELSSKLYVRDVNYGVLFDMEHHARIKDSPYEMFEESE